jgi:hypothetical protein
MPFQVAYSEEPRMFIYSMYTSRDAEKYGDGGNISGFVPLTMKSYGQLGLPAVHFFGALAGTAALLARSDVTKAALSGDLCELEVDLAQGELCDRLGSIACLSRRGWDGGSCSGICADS